MKLTPLQVEQVLIWREEHLKNILAVYEQRQQLNVEVGIPRSLMIGLVHAADVHSPAASN